MTVSIEHSYKLTFEQQYAAALKYRASTKIHQRMQWLNGLAGGFVTVMILRGTGIVFESIAFVLGSLVAYLFTVQINRWYLRKVLRQYMGNVEECECKIEVGPEGVSVEGEDTRTTVKWAGIKDVKIGIRGLEVWNSERAILAIPVAAFEDEVKAEEFAESIRHAAKEH